MKKMNLAMILMSFCLLLGQTLAFADENELTQENSEKYENFKQLVASKTGKSIAFKRKKNAIPLKTKSTPANSFRSTDVLACADAWISVNLLNAGGLFCYNITTDKTYIIAMMGPGTLGVSFDEALFNLRGGVGLAFYSHSNTLANTWPDPVYLATPFEGSYTCLIAEATYGFVGLTGMMCNSDSYRSSRTIAFGGLEVGSVFASLSGAVGVYAQVIEIYPKEFDLFP
jgi:hypothetical protein